MAKISVSIMKYIIRILFFIIIFQFQNCGNKDHPNYSKSTKDIDIKIDFLKESSLEFDFEFLDSINLEVPGNPPLTSIQDLVFSQNFFLLLDRKQGLLKFDNNGMFLLKIGEFGEGPDEYAMPYALHLDEKKNIVYVADWQKMVILTYSLEGKFESTSSKLLGHPISFYKEDQFNKWQNKFIVAGLGSESLWLLDYDMENKRFMSQEKIYIGHRVRDFGISKEGTIVVITDDQNIIKLQKSNNPRWKPKNKVSFP